MLSFQNIATIVFLLGCFLSIFKHRVVALIGHVVLIAICSVYTYYLFVLVDVDYWIFVVITIMVSISTVLRFR